MVSLHWCSLVLVLEHRNGTLDIQTLTTVHLFEFLQPIFSAVSNFCSSRILEFWNYILLSVSYLINLIRTNFFRILSSLLEFDQNCPSSAQLCICIHHLYYKQSKNLNRIMIFSAEFCVLSRKMYLDRLSIPRFSKFLAE